MELEIPETRSDLLRCEVWLNDVYKTVMYTERSGIGPEITNHLSDVTIEAVGGLGVVATKSMLVRLQENSQVVIPAGNTYQVSGDFEGVTTFVPGLQSRFVTIGNEKLGKEEKKILRKIERKILMCEFEDDLMKKVDNFVNISQLQYMLTMPKRAD